MRYVEREVRDDQIECRGMVDATAATTVMRAAATEIRTCYELELRHNRELAGQVRLAMLVGSTGAVEDIDLHGDLAGPSFVDCVRRATARLQFPPPEGGDCAVIAVPLNFRPLDRT